MAEYSAVANKMRIIIEKMCFQQLIKRLYQTFFFIGNSIGTFLGLFLLLFLQRKKQQLCSIL